MPKGSKPIKRPNLGAMSDMELVGLQNHSNDWYVRQSRVILHHRAVTGKLDASKVHPKLEQMLETAETQGKRLRAMWALQVTDGLSSKGGARLLELLAHSDEYVRAWAVQFLCDEKKPSGKALAAFAKMAVADKSPVVRMYLAAALQRMSFDQRWPILEALAAHEEDVKDHLIPRMLWIALEPMVTDHGPKALELALASKMPKLQEFVPRRMLAGKGKTNTGRPSRNPKPSPSWQKDIQRVAPGFAVSDVGEGGVRLHKSFRNRLAVQTHPLKRGVPSLLTKKISVPKGKKTGLSVTVSHHPHGDFELRVKVDGKVVSKRAVSSRTVTDEWLVQKVDLTPYAGKTINLQLENFPSGWRNEWAYWHEVKVTSN